MKLMSRVGRAASTTGSGLGDVFCATAVPLLGDLVIRAFM